MRHNYNRKRRGHAAARKYMAAAAAGFLLVLALAGCSAQAGGTAGSGGTAAEGGQAGSGGTAMEGGQTGSDGAAAEGGQTDSSPGYPAGAEAARPDTDGFGEASQPEDSAGESGSEEPIVIPEAAKELLEDGIAYYGSAGECRMSAKQAEAFAEIIRTEQAMTAQMYAKMEVMDSEVMDGLTPVCGAALIDTGGGLSVLFVAGGSVLTDTMESGTQDWERVSSWSIWQYGSGGAELYQRSQEDVFGCATGQYPALYQDYLLLTVLRSADDCDRNVYRYGDGVIETEAATSAYLRGFDNDGSVGYLYVVDGRQEEKETYDAWNGQWTDGALARFSFEADSPKGSFTGVTPAEKMIGVLTEYAEIAADGGPRE